MDVVQSEVEELIERAIETLHGKRTAVLTGAGISTDSGIPDYRGEGAPKTHPMTLQNFLESPSYRQRYWLGSHLGWGRFAGAKPNAGHTAPLCQIVPTPRRNSPHRPVGVQE